MSKLTLSVDAEVAERAKRYAAENGTSVSQMVESYLALLTKPKTEQINAPIVNSLRGILRGADEQDYKDYLERKYLGKRK